MYSIDARNATSESWIWEFISLRDPQIEHYTTVCINSLHFCIADQPMLLYTQRTPLLIEVLWNLNIMPHRYTTKTPFVN